MIVLELEGIEIDHCLDCGGTWLDAGEIEAITERAGGDVGRLAEAIHAAAGGRRSDRRCPRCRRRLRTIYPAEPPGLELDGCPLHHGLWFDRGEMKTLIAAFASGHEGAVVRFFANLYASEVVTE